MKYRIKVRKNPKWFFALYRAQKRALFGWVNVGGSSENIYQAKKAIEDDKLGNKVTVTYIDYEKWKKP